MRWNDMSHSDLSNVLTEGSEEVQYVYVTLPKEVDVATVGPGTVIKLQDLGTTKPVLHAADGSTVMLGRYIDTIGTVLLMKEQQGPAFNSKPNYSLMGRTEKQLQMTRAD